jgi:hypothetical protein
VTAPVFEEQRVALVIFQRHGNVAAAAREIGAGGEGGEILIAVAARGGAGLNAAHDAFEIALEHEVDDTGNGVRTVDRRVTAGDDVNTLDQIDRDGGDIDRLRARLRGDVADAVLQHQRAGGALATQIKDRQTGGADEAARVLAGEGRAELRQQGQTVTDVHAAVLQQFSRAQRGDRHGGIDVFARDTRTGDHHHFSGGFFGGALRSFGVLAFSGEGW